MELIDVDAAVANGQLDAAIDHFRALGFGLRMISPADAPAVALLEGSGMSVRLVSGNAGWPSDAALAPLVPAFELCRLGTTGWGTGRAGMLYRDLLPSRQGGRFIASHIRISDAGPVRDEVHHHNVQFQLIFCVAGWVRLVYQGQGDPFVLSVGDCVLQPPGIRHRVLESSGTLEVVEISCPAVHATWFDPELSLPTSDQDLDFDGQRFVLHRAAEATWVPWRAAGFECRDTGVETATTGRAEARVVRAGPAAESPIGIHNFGLQFWFMLSGEASLVRPNHPVERLAHGDAVAVPAAMPHGLATGEKGCEFLEVTAPAIPLPRFGHP